jgi:hypothetical protein
MRSSKLAAFLQTKAIFFARSHGHFFSYISVFAAGTKNRSASISGKRTFTASMNAKTSSVTGTTYSTNSSRIELLTADFFVGYPKAVSQSAML